MTAIHPIDRAGDAEPRPRSALRYLPIVLVACGLAIGYALGWHRYLSLEYLADSRDSLMGFADAHPILAPAAFFAAYVLAVAFCFPAASILTIFAGFLFGWATGGCLVVFAATLGASLLFLAARTAFGDTLRNKVGGMLCRVREGFECNAFNTLLVLRLAPIFPFFLVNIAPAFCNVRLRTFVLATLIGILPGTFAYAYLGEGIDSVLAAAQAAGTDISLHDLITPKIKIAFALLAVVAAIPLLVRLVRRRAELHGKA